MGSSDYDELQKRYIAALNLQYTAFKEMLIENAGGNTMPISGIERRSDGSEIFYDADPSLVSEAYLFMPLGYWPSVYDNTMYPSDFPTDLIASMNSGASTVIPGTYTDGDYLMMFCVNNCWKEVRFSIKDGELIRVNEYYPQIYDKQNFHYNLAHESIGMEIDVRPTYHEEIWSELTVVRHAKTEIPSALSVANSADINLQSGILVAVKKQNQLASEMFVWFKKAEELQSAIDVVYGSGINTDIVVMNRKVSEVESELTVMNYNSNGIDSELTVKNVTGSQLPSAINVANNGMTDIPIEVDIKNERAQDLPSEIIVKRWMEAYLASELLIREDGQIAIDSELYVRAKKNSDIDSIIDVSRKNVNIDVSTDITIVGHENHDLDSSIVILAGNRMESKVNSMYERRNELDCEIIIPEKTELVVPTELFVLGDAERMETTVDAFDRIASSISSSIDIANNSSYDMATEMLVIGLPQKMEAVVDAAQYVVHDIQTEFTVIESCSSSLPVELTISFSNLMETRFDGPVYDGADDMTTEITVANVQSSDLESTICIPSVNRMKAVVQTQLGGYSDIASDIFVIHNGENTLPTEMTVGASNRMEAICFHKNPIVSDIPSELIIGTQDDIESEIYVIGDPARMEVHGKTFPNHIHIESGAAIKDATGVSLTPTANYGGIEDIYAGELKQASAYRSTVGFDLSALNIRRDPSYDYFKYEGIQKATLRLYLNRPNNEDVNVKVYQIPYEWQEMGITYQDMMTMPTDAYLGEFKAPNKEGYVDFDVTEVFKDWNNKSDQYAFMLVIDDQLIGRQAVSFSSREGKNAPQLILEHYDALPNADVTDIPTEIEIKPHSGIETEIEVIGAAHADLDVEIEINKAADMTDDLPSEIDVNAITIANDDLPTEIEPEHWNEITEIPTEITPNHWKQVSELGSGITVVRDYSGGIRVYII